MRVSLSMFQMENTIGYISRCFQILVSSRILLFLFVLVVFGSSVQLFGGEATKPSEKAPTSPWIPGLEESSQAVAHELRFSGTVFVSFRFCWSGPTERPA